MKIQKSTLIFCLSAAFVCLVAGYANHFWIILLAAAGAASFAFLTRKQSGLWLSSVILATYVLLTVVGITSGCSPYWMIIGITFALAGWDLYQKLSSSTEYSKADPKSHILILAVAAGSGLMLALIDLQIRLQLPFGVLIVLILLIYLGLESSLANMKKLQ
ncbi:MAG TPA: hypothetical protein VN376_00495 [Longilinea sp.]|nr:hypothetical protein [Longilinea sp.]